MVAFGDNEFHHPVLSIVLDAGRKLAKKRYRVATCVGKQSGSGLVELRLQVQLIVGGFVKYIDFGARVECDGYD